MKGKTNASGRGEFLGTDAILRVQAPAGSVVTISKNGISKSDYGHENSGDHSIYDYYFMIHASQFDSVNKWTVTATLGDDTESDTIIIDTTDEYNIELYYFPSEYQAVEYLQSSGKQYITTSIPANTVNSGTIDFMSTSLKQWAYIYGASDTTSGADPGGLGFSTAFGSSTPYQYGWVYDAHYIGKSTADTNVRHTSGFHYLPDVIEYMLDGETETFDYYLETYTITTNSIYLFAMNYNKGSISDAMKVNARVYSFKLYNSYGNKILDLQPCYRKSDSVAGMWDKVSKTFLTNSGSGTFTVGNNI